MRRCGWREKPYGAAPNPLALTASEEHYKPQLAPMIECRRIQ